MFNTGGQSNNQNIRQTNWTFKNDLTFNDIDWNGLHTLKMGFKFSNQNYLVDKRFGRNPQFIFDVDARPEINGSIDIPVRVELGALVAPADVTNNVIGLYIQDDWQISDQLELNLGIRWDYEDNALNDSYVTPADRVAALRGLDGPRYGLTPPAGQTYAQSLAKGGVSINDYISTGSSRKASSGPSARVVVSAPAPSRARSAAARARPPPHASGRSRSTPPPVAASGSSARTTATRP